MEGILTWLRGHVVALVVAAVALTSLTLGILWWIGFQATDRVTATTGVPQCRGTQPITVKDVSGLRRPAIPMREGFTCTLTISVSNQSDRTVTVQRFVFPFGGPDAGGSYEVSESSGFVAADEGTDAAADLQWDLEPGETQLVRVPLGFRSKGCAAEGTWLTVQPTIEVTALLASHDMRVTDLPVLLGTADSSCNT